MASKATPKRRAAKQAAAAEKPVKGKKAGTGKRAKAGIANGEREEMAPSTVKPATIEHHAAKIFTKRKELDRELEGVGTIRAELSELYKKAKKDGVNCDVLKDIYAMSKEDISVVRDRERTKRRYLTVLKPETAKQLDMFVDTSLAVIDYDAAGYAAYKNNEPQTNNPAPDINSQEFHDWDAGWMRAQVENIKTMGPNNGARAAAH